MLFDVYIHINNSFRLAESGRNPFKIVSHAFRLYRSGKYSAVGIASAKSGRLLLAFGKI